MNGSLQLPLYLTHPLKTPAPLCYTRDDQYSVSLLFILVGLSTRYKVRITIITSNKTRLTLAPPPLPATSRPLLILCGDGVLPLPLLAVPDIVAQGGGHQQQHQQGGGGAGPQHLALTRRDRPHSLRAAPPSGQAAIPPLLAPWPPLARCLGCL